jgi:hypothetical protein
MPATKKYNLRIVVGSADGPRSNVWRVFSKRSQVYVSYGNLGGVTKLSFHSPTICREAFTSDYGIPSGIDNRALHGWSRLATPIAGMGQGSCVLQIGFPTDYLSTALLRIEKPCEYVAAAPSGMITVLEFFFTNETESEIRRLAPGSQRIVVGYWVLPNGERFAITARHAIRQNRDIRMPASHHEESDFVFSSVDPNGTGRPIRLVFFNKPADGEALIGWEHGGYRVPKHTEIAGADTLSRNQVLATNSN